MNTQIILESLLTLHIVGLIVLTGTTFIDYILFKSFWKLHAQEKEKSMSLLPIMSKFPKLMGIGGAIIIATGIGIMASTHGVFGEQLWFRIKFGLIIILILNGVLVGRKQGLKLRKVLNDTNIGSTVELNSIQTNIKRFHVIQMTIFFIIIFLSVFKFN